MTPELKIDLITLGDELLLGLRENGHLFYIGEQLSHLGLSLRRNVTCRDSADEIREAFGKAWESADVVITTGGLGPTSDDNTREIIAEMLGLPLEFHEGTERAIRERFARLGREVVKSNFKQCYLPRGAECMPNGHGTAPGIYYRCGEKHLFMLPGPTSELKPMFAEQVLPRLHAAGLCRRCDSYLQIRTIGVGESALEEKLMPIFRRHSGLGVAYCAHDGMVDVRLSSPDGSLSRESLREIGRECRCMVGEDFICYGTDSLAKVIFDHLRADEKTLAVAESCTGGQLSNAFTDIPGISKVFLGGVICYNNEAKTEMLGVPECILMQHGAVSAETAVAMATGAAERFGSDYALSVTGFAGPSGGTLENPVGTVYIGYHSPCGTWCVRVVFPGERMSVKARAVNRALDVMRRKLCKYKAEDALARAVV